MSKRTRILAAVMATMVMTTAFLGCGSDSTSKDSGEKKKLLVWSHLSTAEVDAIREVAQKWGEENNVDVTVNEDKGEMQAAITTLQSSKGPDIYYGLAHDNLGTYNKAGVLEEVPSDFINKDDYASEGSIDAITIGGKQMAVPLSAECVALFYNKDKVKEAPKTMEEVADSGSFMFNATDFYLTYGFLSANGGYVFKDNNGTLDKEDIGLGNEGAVKGLDFIQKLVTEKKLFAADITDDIAKEKFKAGETSFYISGPWSVGDCKDINLGIEPLPTLAGGTMKPFMGVQAAFVNSKSQNKDLAWKLMKYLNENTNDILIEKGNRLPATKKGQESDKFKANKYASVFVEATKNAVPMPNIPEVQQMWTPGADNLKQLLAGTQTAQEAGTKIVEQMKQGIEQAK
ncbi:MAG: maltose ABC transporter substrate-binding protein [Clostridiales bacterium]|jgi:arabinogalactan oligomer/maltooligosaccharide transport system substrate-binding protein|nr:maltose ABC transporter substrate-binding protein [Clostridiales bacterium]